MRDPGAPLDLYRILTAAGEPELIHREAGEDATILDLGSGPGRITHQLIKFGHRVVAVDFDERMLELIEGAETVLSRIEDLDLGRTFGCVLLMSNLINRSDRAGRLALLATCRRHVAANGLVLIERYDTEMGNDPMPSEREYAGVTFRVSDVRRRGQLVEQTVDIDAGARGHWRIHHDGAYVLSDDELLADLAAARLRLRRWIDERRRWAVATPA